jgi:alpha-L-rhamnosidase
MISISKLTMNYLENPMGITEQLQIGWVIESDKRGVFQKSYELQVATDDHFENCIYNSGVVKSEESAHVFLEGITLKSAVKYFVRVKLVDNYGENSPYSDIAFFITGILDKDLWTGRFITVETKEDSANSKGTYVRKEYHLDKPIKSAFAYSTALGLYEFYINGKKVGKDVLTPGWTSYNKRTLYQTYDVTDYLQTGDNAIAVMLGAGWYKGVMGFVGNRNNYGDRTAFLGQIAVNYEDGSTEWLVTDGTWKGTDAPVVFSEIYDGEIYDARLEKEGFLEAGYKEDDLKAVEIIEKDLSFLYSQEGCRVTEVTELPAKRIFKTPEGDTVVDFGQNLTGWIHLKVKGKAGDRVELKCFEVLDAKGNVYLDNLRLAKQTLVYICKDEKEAEFHPHFTFQGFQYAKIVSYPGELTIDKIHACAVHSDMERTGEFECSNPDLNQLQHNILWGLKGNFLDIPSDCPQRNERLGWTGDAQIFCRTASYLMNTYTFFSKWLKDVAADQTAEGGVPHVVPDILTGSAEDDWLVSQGTHSAAAWADVAVINPWTMYLTYGDKTILKEQYESMKAWIEFMRTHAKDGIWNYRLQFGDWVALDAEEGSYFGATPNDLTCTAYYAYSTGLFAKIADVLGRKEDADKYLKLHEEIVAGFQSHFFDKDGNMTAQTQTSHIIALYFNLVPEIYREQTTQALLKLLEKENGHLVTGFVGTPYFCHALSQNGHTKEAYELLLKDDFPSWLYQVKMGATTVWEHWDGMKPDGTMWSPDMNSFNHYAYGAIGEWLYRVVAGIEIDEKAPGYKHAVIYPHLGGGLTYVKSEYKSVYGVIKVNWQIDNDLVKLEVTIPANTTASIYLEQVKEIKEKDGLTFTAEGELIKAEAASGTYCITYEI